jgi:hypothetical protein
LIAIGIALGLLISLISGAVALVLLKTANKASLKDVSSLVALTSEILAIPTFWFSGAWLTGRLLKDIAPDKIMAPYSISLAVSFTLIVGYPIFRWIVSLGEQLGRRDEGNNA